MTPDNLSVVTAKAIEDAMDDITIDGDPGIEKGLVAGGDFSLTISFDKGEEAPNFTGVQLCNTETGEVVEANTLSVRVEGTNLIVEGLLPDVTGTFRLKLGTDYQGENPEKYGNILLQEQFTITQAEEEPTPEPTPEPETVDLNLVNFNLASYFPSKTFESGTTPTVDIPASFDLSKITGDGPFEVMRVELNEVETALGQTGVEAHKGENTVAVTVLEKGGDNQEKTIIAFFTLEAVDTIAPSTPTVSELPENNQTTADVTTVLVDGEIGSIIYVNGESTRIVMQNPNGEYIELDTSILGEHTFSITAKDPAGNESEPETITLERVETGGVGGGTGEGGF